MWNVVKENIWVYSNFTGSDLIPIMENVLWIFEESVANGDKAEVIVGSDVAKFCEAVADKENPYDYRNIMRKRLDNNVNKNLKRGNLV